MQDSFAQQIFGELRARFTRPACRETFLQIIGYSLHLWEFDPERSEQNLSAYILDNLTRWQERLPPTRNVRVSAHIRPRDEPLALHGNLLDRAIAASCGWLPALRAINLFARDPKKLLATPDALASLSPAHLSYAPDSKKYDPDTRELFHTLDLSCLESLSILYNGFELSPEILDTLLEFQHTLLEDFEINHQLTPALFIQTFGAEAFPALKRLRLDLSLGIDADTFERNGPMNFLASRTLEGLHIGFRNSRGLDLPSVFIGNQFPALEHLSLDSAAPYRAKLYQAFGDARERFPALRSLSLAHCFLSNFHDEPELVRITALLDEHLFAQVERLELIHCNLQDADLITLIESGQMERIEHLDLRYNEITDTSLSLLADPKHLPKLASVELSGTDCSPKVSCEIQARLIGSAETPTP